MTLLPLVSIIMPAYNAEKYIEESISSIIDQTYANWELLVCDDSSSDETFEKIGKYSDGRIRVFKNGENLGYLKTCNILFEMCRGDYITFQDADDVSASSRIEKLLSAFRLDSALGMVGSWAEIIDRNGKHLGFDRRPTDSQSIKDSIADRNVFCGATVMITREVYSQIGGYREFFDRISYQDYDWTYLIVDRYKAVNIDFPLYKYRQHGGSTSKIIDARRLVADKVVRYLGEQRKALGYDDLQSGDLEAIKGYMAELLRPYELDTSLVYREYAGWSMYAHLRKKAIILSWMAVRANPRKLVNWRTLVYCLRRSLVEG